MKRYTASLLFSLVFFFLACKKSKTGEEDNPTTNPNWEIVQSFNVASGHYERASLAILNDNVFLSASSYDTGKPVHVFLFKSANGWQNYQKDNEVFIKLFTYKGNLYGIMNYSTPGMSGQVQITNHSYYFYKWSNSAFQNIGKYDHTNIHGQKNIAISNMQLWQKNNQLYLLGNDGTVTYQWNISNEKFENRTNIDGLPLSYAVTSDNQLINGLAFGETTTGTITKQTVRGVYYDGQQVRQGNQYTFTQENIAGGFDNTYWMFYTIQQQLFGYKQNSIHNIDTDKPAYTMSEDLLFRVERKIIANGKIYHIVTDRFSNCRKISVFDGLTVSLKDYRLPAELDPCSIILDIVEYQGKNYLALLSNRKLYVVKER